MRAALCSQKKASCCKPLEFLWVNIPAYGIITLCCNLCKYVARHELKLIIVNLGGYSYNSLRFITCSHVYPASGITASTVDRGWRRRQQRTCLYTLPAVCHSSAVVRIQNTAGGPSFTQHSLIGKFQEKAEQKITKRGVRKLSLRPSY